jgi:hypothetical protein
LIRKATVFQRGDLMRYTTTCWHPRVVSVNPSTVTNRDCGSAGDPANPRF